MDFAGLTYNIVEVNPVTKKQLGWSAYKKVPIVIVKVKDGYQVGVYLIPINIKSKYLIKIFTFFLLQQLNDSSMIISSLASYLADTEQGLQKIVKYYPRVEFEDNGKKGYEIMNRYFLMFGDQEPVNRTKESIV